MTRLLFVGLLLFLFPEPGRCEETFVSIQKVVGNRMAVVKDSGGAGGRGRGRPGSGQVAGGTAQTGSRRGRGRFAGRTGTATVQPTIVTVPATAKITSAMRERRTFEFRVGAELAGGMRNRIFQNMKEPLSARIVTAGNRITEINVITDQTDINQSNTDSSGQAVIAIRPKRPPMKRK